MTFCYHRTLRLAETDAAGVIYFAQALTLCHEAYEAALEAAGIDFNTLLQTSTILPIVHAQVDFRQPIRWGDRLWITLTPHPENDSTFSINFEIVIASSQSSSPSIPAVVAQTRHVCIERHNRSRQPLPRAIANWIEQNQAPKH